VEVIKEGEVEVEIEIDVALLAEVTLGGRG